MMIYQILHENDFQSGAFDNANVTKGKVDDNQLNTMWHHINKMKIVQTNLKWLFKLLFILAEAVLVIPHSNAEPEERFSIVKKNKDEIRFSLKLNSTPSSILAMKWK